ncbi:MAG: YiiD C-terminal domain-containing protein [Ghiorsea sp.]
MDTNLSEVLAYVHEHIPITTDLGADIKSYDGDSIAISAPLDKNINHRGSGFGGSLSALAILSGWALLFIKMKELGLQTKLVIQSSSFEFTNPVVDDFETVCSLPPIKKYERFLKTLNKHGRARITVDSEVFCNGLSCGIHRGVYVAVKIP